MYDILVYLFENYYTPQACPAADVLARRLAAAGFEDDDIDEALSWLGGLAESTERCASLGLGNPGTTRIYSAQEYQAIGSQALGFVSFLESAGALPAALREIVLDRAIVCAESPVSLETIKVIALMVLWSQEAEIDRFILEELLEQGDTRPLH